MHAGQPTVAFGVSLNGAMRRLTFVHRIIIVHRNKNRHRSGNRAVAFATRGSDEDGDP
jgi:hypothetical protein